MTTLIFNRTNAEYYISSSNKELFREYYELIGVIKSLSPFEFI